MIILAALIIVTAIAIPLQAIRIPYLQVDAQSSHLAKTEKLNQWLITLHNKQKFNGTVLIAKGGDIVFSKSYGLDGSETGSHLHEHSSFNLASVSKQFTAMAIVLLKENGKISYDDPLGHYIPELSFYDSITLRQLLNHTSGLPDYMRLAKKHLNPSELFTTYNLIELFREHQPLLKFEPSEKFEYSNTGYVLLAEVVARVSGQSFSEYMTANIFKPLEMNDSQVFNLLSNRAPATRVFGYSHTLKILGETKKPNDLNFFDGVVGDGAIYASAHDLFLWHKALQEGAIVSHEAYLAAYTPAKLNSGKSTHYGFGWFLNKDTSVEHAGGWLGFATYVYRNPKNSGLIVILDNSTNTLRANSFGFRFNSIGLNLKHWLNAY
jgi:CubicO group peptidase (beta-lactamase class C family)